MGRDLDMHDGVDRRLLHAILRHRGIGKFHLQFGNVVGVHIIHMVEMEAARAEKAIQGSNGTARVSGDVLISNGFVGGFDDFNPQDCVLCECYNDFGWNSLVLFDKALQEEEDIQIQ